MISRLSTRTAVLAAAITLAASCGADAGPIYIGVAGPVSAPNGRSMRLAAEMAVQEINSRGGIDGRDLALVVRDDAASSETAIEVAQELRDDPRIVAVVGHVNSSATLAAAAIYNEGANPVLQISPASSSPRVSTAGRWTFRVCPSDLQHGPALARWAAEQLGGRRIAVLYANDAYGRGVVQSFDEGLEGSDAQVIARDPYRPELLASAEALDPYLERAIARGMDVLMIAGQASEAETIIRAARRLGYDGPVVGADGLTGLTAGGGIAEGVYVSSAFLPDRPDTAAQRFVRAYVDAHGEPPDHRGAMTYDTIHLIARALREVGPDRERLRDHVAGIGTTFAPFPGVSGSIAFDENGDVVDKPIAIGVVRDGRLVTASE